MCVKIKKFSMDKYRENKAAQEAEENAVPNEIDDLIDDEEDSYAAVAAQKQRSVDGSNRRRRRLGHAGTIISGKSVATSGNVGKTILGG